MSLRPGQEDAAVRKILDFICSDWTPDAATQKAARKFILDALAVGLSGVRVPFAGVLYRLLLEDCGDTGTVTAWGWPQKLSASTAAMLNAYQIHNQEYDCVHEEAVVHPMAVILSSLLAFAEHQGKVNGQAFLSAVCLAVDVATLLGVASIGSMQFFRPGVCGALGATAGMARLAKLPREQARHALGITYSQLGGTMQAHLEGSPVLPMQIAFNARNAVTAVRLTQAGLHGPAQFLQGQFGFYRLFEKSDNLLQVLDRLGDGEIKNVSHKPFPTGRAAQGVIDALLRLKDQGHLKTEQVTAIKVSAPPLICRLVNRPASTAMNAAYARLCLGYIVAKLLQKGTVAPCDFDPAEIENPDWEPLAAKVTIEVSALKDPNRMTPQQVTVSLADGSTQIIHIDQVLGSPDYPLTDSQQQTKFNLCLASSGLSLQPKRIIKSVAQLEDLSCMRALTPLLRAA